MADDIMADAGSSAPDDIVALSGGNALGAFHGGVVEAFLDHGILPQHVAGTSIGAVTAALWLGGPIDGAVDRLRAFWQAAADKSGFGLTTTWRKSALTRALLLGRAGLFHPSFPGVLAAFPGAPADDHLFDTRPMHRLLDRMVDVDALNASPTRVTVLSLDQSSGEVLTFDNRSMDLTIDHVLASASLPLAFPPVVIDGRPMVDAGLSENCPVRRLFDHPITRPTRCWVADLWPARAPRASSLDEVLGRTQDLAFAAQRQWALEHVRTLLDRADANTGPVEFRELILDQTDWEVGGKAFDYTPASLQRRWAAGRTAVATALAA